MEKASHRGSRNWSRIFKQKQNISFASPGFHADNVEWSQLEIKIEINPVVSTPYCGCRHRKLIICQACISLSTHQKGIAQRMGEASGTNACRSPGSLWGSAARKARRDRNWRSIMDDACLVVWISYKQKSSSVFP